MFALTATNSDNAQLVSTCKLSLRIASSGYLFMAFSLAVQGVLQAYRKAITPLIISLLRLVVFVVPVALIFINLDTATSLVWLSFPIAEFLTAIVSVLFLKKLISTIENCNKS